MTNVVEKYEPNLWLKLDDINVTDGAVAFNSGYNYTAGSWVFRSDQWTGQQLTLPYNGVNSVVTSNPYGGGPNPLEDCRISVNAPYDGMDMSGSTVEAGSPLAMMWYKVHDGIFGPQYPYWDGAPVAFYLMNQYPNALYEGVPILYENVMKDLVEFVYPGTGHDGWYDHCTGGGYIGQFVEVFQTCWYMSNHTGGSYTPFGMWNDMLDSNEASGPLNAWSAVINFRQDRHGWVEDYTEFDEFPLFDHFLWTLRIVSKADARYLEFSHKATSALDISINLSTVSAPGLWDRVVVTYDGLADDISTPGGIRIYVKDTLLGSAGSIDSSLFRQITDDKVFIGRDRYKTCFLWGWVDSVAFYDKELSQAYITATWALHTSPGGLAAPPDYSAQGTLEYAKWDRITGRSGASLLPGKNDRFLRYDSAVGGNAGASWIQADAVNLGGKRYAEFKAWYVGHSDLMVNLFPSRTYTEYTLTTPSGRFDYRANGEVWFNDVFQGFSAPYRTDDYISMAWDGSTGEVWVAVNNVWSSPLTTGTQPYRPTTGLLLHMDGADAGTSFTDSSIYNHTVTPSGGVQTATAQSVYGGASAYFPSNPSILYLDDGTSGATDIWNEDFTIEFHIYFTSNTGNKWVVGRPSSGGYSTMLFYQTGNQFVLYASSTGFAWNVWSNQVLINPITLNQWYHIAVTRRNGYWRGFRDGTQIWAQQKGEQLYTPYGTGWLLGNYPANPIYQFLGYIDEFRLVVGQSLYNGSFTPSGPHTIPADNPGDPSAGTGATFTSAELQKGYNLGSGISTQLGSFAMLELFSDPADYNYTPPTGFDPWSHIRPRYHAATNTRVIAPATARVAEEVDPYWEFVQLLMRFDNTDEPTTFIGEGFITPGLSQVGSAVNSATQSRWPNGGALYLAGDGSSIQNPSSFCSPAYWLCNGDHTPNIPVDFTIEAWVYITGPNIGWTGNYNQMIFSLAGGGSGVPWQFYVRCDTSTTFDGLSLYDGTTTFTGNYTFSTNTWYHVAATRFGTDLRLFVDGTQVGSTGSSSGLGNSVRRECIGGYSATVTFCGYIDELRYTKGISRYNTNFTAPTARFPSRGVDPYSAADGVMVSTYWSPNQTIFPLDPRRRYISRMGGHFPLVDVQNDRNMDFSGQGWVEVIDFDGSLNFGDSDFTIIFGIAAWGSGQGIKTIFSKRDGATYGPLEIYINSSIGNGQFGYRMSYSGTAWDVDVTNAGTATSNGNYQTIRFARSGTSLYFQILGKITHTGSVTGALVSNNAPIRWGYSGDPADPRFYHHSSGTAQMWNMVYLKTYCTDLMTKNVNHYLPLSIEPLSDVTRATTRYDGLPYNEVIRQFEPDIHLGLDEVTFAYDTVLQALSHHDVLSQKSGGLQRTGTWSVGGKSLVRTHGYSYYNPSTIANVRLSQELRSAGFGTDAYGSAYEKQNYVKWTAIGWFEPIFGQGQTTSYMGLLGISDGTHGGTFCAYDYTNDYFIVYRGVTTGSSGAAYYELFYSPATGIFVENQPNFIVYSSTDYDSWRLWCNGVELTSWTRFEGYRARKSQYTPATYFTVGCPLTTGWSSRSFTGYIDEISFFWNRELRQVDIDAIMAAGGLQSDGMGGFETFDPHNCLYKNEFVYTDDDYWRFTTLSVNFTGTNGDTTATDISPLARTITFNGDATIQNNQLNLPGTNNSRVTILHDQVYRKWSEDWTIEMAVTPTALPGGSATLVVDRNNAAQDAPVRITLNSNGTVTGAVKNSALTEYTTTSTTVLSTGVEYRIALERYGDTVTLYINDVAEGTPITLPAETSYVYELATNLQPWQIGSDADGNAFTGSVRSFRFTLHWARHSVVPSYVQPNTVGPLPAGTLDLTYDAVLPHLNGMLIDSESFLAGITAFQGKAYLNLGIYSGITRVKSGLYEIDPITQAVTFIGLPTGHAFDARDIYGQGVMRGPNHKRMYANFGNSNVSNTLNVAFVTFASDMSVSAGNQWATAAQASTFRNLTWASYFANIAIEGRSNGTNNGSFGYLRNVLNDSPAAISSDIWGNSITGNGVGAAFFDNYWWCSGSDFSAKRPILERYSPAVASNLVIDTATKVSYTADATLLTVTATALQATSSHCFVAATSRSGAGKRLVFGSTRCTKIAYLLTTAGGWVAVDLPAGEHTSYHYQGFVSDENGRVYFVTLDNTDMSLATPRIRYIDESGVIGELSVMPNPQSIYPGATLFGVEAFDIEFDKFGTPRSLTVTCTDTSTSPDVYIHSVLL